VGNHLYFWGGGKKRLTLYVGTGVGRGRGGENYAIKRRGGEGALKGEKKEGPHRVATGEGTEPSLLGKRGRKRVIGNKLQKTGKLAKPYMKKAIH